MVDDHISRRKLLTAVGAVGGVAGCSGVLDDGDAGATGTPSPDSPTDTDPGLTEGEITAVEIAPTEPETGEYVDLSVTVANGHDTSSTGTLRVSVGEDVSEHRVTIPADDTTTRTLTAERWQAGTHEVAVELFGASGPVDAAGTTFDVVPTHDAFVEVSGTEFVIDGEPVYYSGGHSGGNLNSRTSSDEENGFEYEYDDAFEGDHYVADFMRYAAAYDMSVIRVVAAAISWAEDSLVHEAPGEFNEAWFELFDTVVAEAKRNDIRLVISPLSHDMNLAPSPGAYAQWSDTVDKDQNRDAIYDSFYEDEQAKQYYKNFLEKLLTRENHITGIEYREDPTILMLECGNEIEYALYDDRGKSLADWYDEIARYIKSLDENHLVGSGMYGSDARNEFVTDHRSEAIDVCSFHLYPKYPNRRDIAEKPYEEDPVHDMSIEEMSDYVERKIETAHSELGKPVILGEFNVPQFPDIYGWDLELRREFFEAMYDAADRADLNGVHAFALTLNEKCTEEVRITDCRAENGIYPDDELLSLITAYGDTVAAKSDASMTE
ncbi:cellulase family glycosylhydrolase [Halorarius halobius]|uniref:cellulase family glycosylhydrolase n=1 Tax=Halorarius halobius TaxID=2962671 RepID=UPI0020CD39DC|nr:cellulase family glycosylhydrolase [Halorarius halobius]